MKKEQLLAQYSTLALSILLCKNSEGQVLYTDIDPNVWWQWDANDFELLIDVDQDGLMDFRFFTCSSWTEYYSCSGFAGAFFISAYRSNLLGNTMLPLPTPSELGCVCVGICDSFYNQTMGVRPALLGDTISLEDNWGIAELIYAENDCDSPDPHYGLLTRTDDYDYYIPLQLKDHGIHFGWVRLDHLAIIAEKIIFDMAYETQEGQPIIAGDTSDLVDVEQLEDNFISNIYCYEGILNISLHERLDGKIILYDMHGNEIFTDYLNDKYYSTQLNVPRGIYMVKLETNNINFSKQIFIQ